MTDAGGLSDTATESVHVGSQGGGIAFVGSDDSQGNAAQRSVTVPSGSRRATGWSW